MLNIVVTGADFRKNYDPFGNISESMVENSGRLNL